MDEGMDHESLASELMVLGDGDALPAGAIAPPRQPHWYDTIAYIQDPQRFCRENWQRYGPVFQTGVFGGVTVFVGSARANQMVFNGDLHYTEIGLPATTMEMFGEHSLFQRPDLHRQRKAALRPGFTGQLLDNYLPQINQMVRQAVATWPSQGAIALFPTVEALCFDLLVPFLLGVNLSAQDSTAQPFAGLPIGSMAELKALYKTFFDGFYGLVKWNSPLTAYGRGMKARQRLIEFMRAVIQRRRQGDLNPTADFLSMLLASQRDNPDGIVNDALIENQCLLQLWASHYEVSGLVSSLIYQLGVHPEIKQRVVDEQARVLPGRESLALADQLKQMIYLDATIKETLRVLPPTSTANRRFTQTVVLDGVRYQKGWAVIAEPRIAHIMPDHFADPDKFDPDRFLPDRNEGKGYTYIPFGGGVHACLGAQFAIATTKVFMAQLLQQMDWTVTEPAQFVQFPLKRISDRYTISVNRR